MTKTLSLEYDPHYGDEEIIKAVKGIVLSHEPDIDIIDKNRSVEETFLLEGLSCANCAVKMEDEIGKIHGIEGVSIDFVTKKMRVMPTKGSLSELELEKIKSIVSEIEGDSEVWALRDKSP
ncbi:MAG TPA: hypothetical protein DHM90_03895 [Clostridiaceae bacterium]|nr:hypothetical protein [Clostridiaceae bacterium]